MNEQQQERSQEDPRVSSGGLRIASIAGIPLIIHYSWLAIFALITVNLTIVFGQPGFHPEWDLPARIIVSLVTSLLFFGSVLVHELAHSLLSIRYGYPVHNITLFIFGGASHIAQEAEKPGEEALIAFVGPLTSFILGGLFLLVSFTVGSAVDYIGTAA
ncbi:MAG: site-2 protease family protein, partial [Dehalococcoidia bacterium]